MVFTQFFRIRQAAVGYVDFAACIGIKSPVGGGDSISKRPGFHSCRKANRSGAPDAASSSADPLKNRATGFAGRLHSANAEIQLRSSDLLETGSIYPNSEIALPQKNAKSGAALLNDRVVFMRRCARKARRNSRLRRMASVRSRYFLTVNGTENPVFSHIIFSTPPPVGFASRAIVNWLTVLSSVSFFKSIRASSFVASSSSL